MVRKILAALVLIPLGLIILAFAIANREIITVSFDPFDTAQPAFVLRMPLFVLIFVLLILGVLIGGFAAWLRQGRYRNTARALKSDVTGLRQEIALLNSRLEASVPPGRDLSRLPSQTGFF